MDKLNVEADLSVGDNYTQKDDSVEGSSSLMIRTACGQKAWEHCKDEFFMYRAEYQDIAGSQHLEKSLKTSGGTIWFLHRHRRGARLNMGFPVIWSHMGQQTARPAAGTGRA